MEFEHEIKVGAFILASIALLVFIIMWLHKFDVTSQLHIYARFKDTGALSSGTNVLYRGVKVGLVDRIDLSNDHQYALVRINIKTKEIDIYQGSSAIILDKGFTGNKIVSILPPENIEGRVPLEDGGVIPGIPSFTIEELEKTLTRLNNSGTLDEMVQNMRDLLIIAKTLSERLNHLIVKVDDVLDEDGQARFSRLIRNMNTLSINLNSASLRLNNLLSDRKLTGDLKQAANNTKVAMDKFGNVTDKASGLIDKTNATVGNFDRTINNLDSTVTNIDNTVNNQCLKGSLRSTLEKADDVLNNIQNMTKDGEIKVNIGDSLNESLGELKGLHCFTSEFSRMLSKPMLLPRLLLGRPGATLERCTDPNNPACKKLKAK